MKHPLENLIRLEIISLIIAILALVFIFIKGFAILLFVALFFLSVSTLVEAAVVWSKHDKANAIKHGVKGVILITLTMYITLMLKVF